MNKRFMLCRTLQCIPLYVFPTPVPDMYNLTYPVNCSVIIQGVVRNENNEYGEISGQSLLVFTSHQDKEMAQTHANGYLVLFQNGIPFVERL